jgi:hypothetical protein
MTKTELNPILDDIGPGDLDLAQRLLSLRQEPGPELRRRLWAIPQQPKRRPARLSRLSWGLATIIIVTLLFVSPAAKATLGSVDQFIGRIHLIILDILPRSTPPVAANIRLMSLPQARAALSFDLATPAYLPDSLAARAPEVSLIELERPIVKILWRDAKGGFVQLTTYYPGQAQTGQPQTLVGPVSSEAILINGQQAVLVRGGWDEMSQMWSHQDRLITLIWQTGRLQHKLLCFSDLISVAELVAMAESIR